MSGNRITQGAHHIGLTVPDLDATRSFFTDVLGFDQLGAVPDYPAVFLSDGTTMITLWQAQDPAQAVPFDRKANVGLHHLAFSVADTTALEALYGALKATAGVVVEFAPEPLNGGPARHMMCAIPGGIRT